jgi:hypothetical protein
MNKALKNFYAHSQLANLRRTIWYPTDLSVFSANRQVERAPTAKVSIVNLVKIDDREHDDSRTPDAKRIWTL